MLYCILVYIISSLFKNVHEMLAVRILFKSSDVRFSAILVGNWPFSVETFELTGLFFIVLSVQLRIQSSIGIQTHSLFDGKAAVTYLDNSLACTVQVDLLRFIKGVWSLMLSPLINFNSTSDRLSGTPRDTHAHIQMRAEWWMWEGKEGNQKMVSSRRHV